MFKCPKCSFSGLTWKACAVHMSRKHGGYSEREKLEISRQASSSVSPADSSASFTVPPAMETPPEEIAAPSGAVPPLSARFQALKGKFAKGLAVLCWQPVAQALNLEALKDEDRKTLTEGWEAALDCLDIQPAFNARKFELKSWLWAFLFPILALALVVAERLDYTALWDFVNATTQDKPDRGDHRSQRQRENLPRNPADPSSQADGSI